MEHFLERAVRFLEVAFGAQRFDQRRVRRGCDNFSRPLSENASRGGNRFSVHVEMRAE